MSEIRRAGGCPILTGENLNRRHGFWDVIARRAVDLVAPDFQKCGGLLEGKRIGEASGCLVCHRLICHNHLRHRTKAAR